MKRTFLLLLCLAAGMAFAEAPHPTNRHPHQIGEIGKRALGYHIVAEEGVDHHPAPEGDTPIVNYYVADKNGRKRSGAVDSVVLGKENTCFVWTNHQRCLVVTDNRRKSCWVSAYALDSKGNFKMLDTRIDSRDEMIQIAMATYLKGHPDRRILPDDQFGGENVEQREISVDETSVDFPVSVDVQNIESEWVIIRYRFDVETGHFYRLDATLMVPYGHRVVTLSNAQLEKAMKKIVLKKG